MAENDGSQATKALLESGGQRAAVIFNPASGTQDPQRRRAALEELLHAAGLTAALGVTDREHGAVPLARKAVADGVERLLACGGDGTATEAAGALVGSPVALAVLPGGTGNLLALNLGIPADAEAAVRLALTSEARPMDVGRANGSVFLIMAGMGLDAHMVRDADREMKERLGVLAYLIAVLRNCWRPPTRYALTLDGQLLHRRARSILVANLGRITGGLELVPGADPEDGLLDVAILRARGFWDLLVLAFGTLIAHPPASRCLQSDALLEIHRAREILIETVRPQPVELDGNEAPPTERLEIHVEPCALRVVRPAAAEPAVSLAATPIAALSRGAGIAWQLLAGAAAASLVYFRARAARDRGDRPGLVERHPFLVGLSLGAAATFWRRRRAPSECPDAEIAPPETTREEPDPE